MKRTRAVPFFVAVYRVARDSGRRFIRARRTAIFVGRVELLLATVSPWLRASPLQRSHQGILRRHFPACSDTKPIEQIRAINTRHFASPTYFARRALAGALVALLGTSGNASALSGGVPASEAIAARGADAPLARQVASHVVWYLSDAARGAISACSGTLVHPQVVLTAAHCIASLGEPMPRTVVAFGMDITQSLLDSRSTTREVVMSMTHPQFKRVWSRRRSPVDIDAAKRSYSFSADDDIAGVDVALLLLHRPAPDTHRAAPVGALGRSDRQGELAIAGFGQRERNTQGDSPRLRFATAPARRAMEGNRAMEDRDDVTLTSIDLASAFRAGKRVSACSGDSGGALFYRGNGGLRLVGVIAAGDTACREVSRFASVEANRAALRRMFDELTDGMAAQRENPF